MFYGKKSPMPGIKSIKFAIYFIVIGLGASACTPSFNWREVGFEQADAKALLPCKPDRGSRPVKLAGQEVLMHMAGCESGGAMFAVALVEVKDAQRLNSVAEDWKAQNKATHSRMLMHGAHIIQASIYGQPKEGKDGPSALSTQAVETFLTGLQLAGAASSSHPAGSK
jgi:hypothetical protein